MSIFLEKNIVDNYITVYGRDYTPIDSAYISWDELDESGTITRKVYQVTQFPEIRDSLVSFLWIAENKIHNGEGSDVVIVAHSSDKDDVINKQDKNWNIISEYRNSEWFGSLVGTLRGSYTNEEVQIIFKIIIYTRFDHVSEKITEQPKPYFLASLLLKGNLKFESSYNVDFDYDSLFEFYLLWQLKKDLKEALFKGLFRQYRRFERNDDRLRGSIDVARNIKLNMGMDNGRVAYSFRENSTDNAMNHLLLSAYDYLAEKYPGIVDENFDDELVGQLNSLKYEINYPQYSRNEIFVMNSTPISHPYYSDYRKLQKTCLMILRDEAISPFGDSDEDVDGILYYVPDLWEEYLSFYLKEKIDDLGIYNTISMTAQMKIPIMMSLNGTFEYDSIEDSKINSSYPDYVFLDGDCPFCILDAKYKKEWEMALEGILSSRCREDYDKCIRDMESVLGTACGVIFPIDGEMVSEEIQIDHFFSNFNQFGNFYTFPVLVPSVKMKKTNGYIQAEPYEKWSLKMKKSINATMNVIADSLSLEANRKNIYQEKINEILEHMEAEYKADGGYLHRLNGLGNCWKNYNSDNIKKSKKEVNKKG